MDSISARTAMCSVCLTRGSQAVVARIAGKPGILQAAGSGDIALVQDHLISNASCVNVTDTLFQRTPLHVSAEKGHVDVSRLLISSKADVDARNSVYDPLHA